MKKILTIILLCFMWSHTVLAAGIEDFEIEDISVGDSLLKYYSEKDIKKIIDKKQKYKDKSFVRGAICSKDNPQTFCKKVRGDFDTYDAIQFHFKKKDPEYKLYMISGIREFADDIAGCKLEKSKIVKELRSIFPDARMESKKSPHPSDKTKRSITHSSYYFLKDGSSSRIQCYEWSKKIKTPDYLKVSLDHSEYVFWAKNKAWK
tara:strand:+ start:87 stop:701 length:615 start_codon:yes stop_codon:yes gene_type:complete